MKHFPVKQTAAAVFFIAALHSASALPSFDPFADATATGGTSYAVGSPLAPNTSTNTQGGLNAWALVNSNSVPPNPQPMVVADNLTYSGLPASTGNSVSLTPPSSGSGGSARLGLNLSASPSLVYYSFILKVTDISALATANANNPIAALSDTVGGQAPAVTRMGGRLVAKTSGTGYVLGVGKGSTTTDYRYDTTERAVGDEVFVVVAYERTGSATNVNLWVNPLQSSLGAETPPPPAASVPQGSAANDLNANGARAFILTCQYVNCPSCVVDELRIATSWAVVTGGNPTFPISIDAPPAPRTVQAGDRVAFAVSASGTLPKYQWRFNGTDIPDATNAAYPLASAQAANAGTYTVVVTNSASSRTSAPAVLTVSATPLPLFETNLVVVRVGDGAQTLATSGNSVFLDQFTPNGAYVNTVFIPDTGPSAIIETGPDLGGSVLTGTALSRSADQRLMTLAGYNVALGNPTALQNTYSTNVPRAVVTVDSHSQVTLALADTNAYSAGYYRGAATDGTNNFWGSGQKEGTWYFGRNVPAALVQATFANTRSVDIFNGNLYTLASGNDYNGLLKFNGLPTTDQGIVPNMLPGFTSIATTDFAVDPTDTLIYLTVGSAVEKWQFDGSAWSKAYTLTSGLTEQARYLAADFSGAAPVLYVTTADPGTGMNRLVTFVDTNSSATAVTLATSGPNQLFKGIRFGPKTSTQARPTLAYAREGGNLILSWSGPFSLISSTNVAGPYDVVPGATSPYTNSMSAPAARFFGLRQ